MKIELYSNDISYFKDLSSRIDKSFNFKINITSIYEPSEESILVIDSDQFDIIPKIDKQSIILYNKNNNSSNSDHLYIYKFDFSTLINTIKILLRIKNQDIELMSIKQRFKGAFDCSGSGMAIVDLNNV